MTISKTLKKYKDIEADLLLGHVLKQSKEFLYLRPHQKLTAAQRKRFIDLVRKRRAKVPAAYLLGYKYFYSLQFKVNRKVLIPRPETEWLVDDALGIVAQKLKRNPKTKLKILDVGTGSGCIAVSIAKNTDSKKVQVSATDISASALRVARSNAKAHNAKVIFSQSDLLQSVRGQFDIIIANLPYVPVHDYQKLYENLRHEPKPALTDGTNKFILIQRLLGQAQNKLTKQGVLLLETDPSSLPTLKQALHQQFTNKKVQIVNDHRDLARFIKIY